MCFTNLRVMRKEVGISKATAGMRHPYIDLDFSELAVDPQIRRADYAMTLGQTAYDIYRDDATAVGDTVKEAKNRAITLKQLYRVWAYVRENADEHGVLTGWYAERHLCPGEGGVGTYIQTFNGSF